MTRSPKLSLEVLPDPSRKSRVETYLWDAGDGSAEEVAEEFYDPGIPLADTVVLIPVAAEQEKDSIDKAMAEYAKQHLCEPFTVALLLNHQTNLSADRQAKVNDTLNAAHDAKRRYADKLDIRVALQSYAHPTIGKIRKDLWDGVAFLAHSEGLFDIASGEVIGVNHDIDTESIDPSYISNIQNTYDAEQYEVDRMGLPGYVMHPRYTYVRHHHPFETHPMTARAVYWADFTLDAVATENGYEEGTVIPFSHYAKSGGFRRDARTYETNPLAVDTMRTIPGTDMRTSPRRYISRFPQFGFEGIWSDETFTDVDECRDEDGRDATREEFETHMADSAERYINGYFLVPAVRAVYKDFIQPRATQVGSAQKHAEFMDETRHEFVKGLSCSLVIATRGLKKIGMQHMLTDAWKTYEIDEIISNHLEVISAEIIEMNALNR